MDQHNSISPALALAIAQRTASVNGATIDLVGFSDVTFVIQTAATTTADADNRFDFKIQHSNDNSTWEDVAAADVQGSASINAATQDDVIVGKMSYTPTENSPRRYVRLVATEVGTADSTFGAIAIRGGARKMPV